LKKVTKNTKKTQDKLFNSKRVFLLLFFIFIVLVIIRFIAIIGLNISSKDTYLYQFNSDIYANFYIENNQTIYYNGTIRKILYPYSFIELNFNKQKAIYQLIPDKKEHTISLFTRPKWFEIIGGDYKSRDGDSIIRFNKNDKPSLLIFNADNKHSLVKAKKLKVIALTNGYIYHSLDNKKIPIPIYDGKLENIRNSKIWKILSQNGVILNNGYIKKGDDIIKIYLDSKNKSVLISKKPKKYNLVKRATINISIVDKNIPSSKLKLVYADKALYKSRLSYNFVRIAHLLIKYGVSNAKNTILNKIDKDNFLQKELLNLLIDSKSLKNEKFYQEYLTRRAKLSKRKKDKLDLELLKYVSDGDYYRTKMAILFGANVHILNQDGKNLLEIVLSNQKNYLSIPEIMEFQDNKLTIRGNKNIFKNTTYTKNAYFPSKVPIFDKPKIPKYEYLNVDKLNEFVDVTHLNGIYISDKDAKIYYSKTPKNFLQIAKTDYKKSPPLFLYDGKIDGRFVAPIENLKGKFYYKIETKKKKIQVAFNGKIKQDGRLISKNYNQITPFYSKYTINIKNNSTILEVSLDNDFLPCGVIFKSSRKIKNFRYSYNGKVFNKFKVFTKGHEYYYKIQKDLSKTFKLYLLKIKADQKATVIYLGDNRRYNIGKNVRTINYTPSLICLAKKYTEKNRLSLYDKDNMMELIPKSYQINSTIQKNGIKTTVNNDTNITKNSINTLAISKLLPIYGDGMHFGLTSKGIKAQDLTIDASFSQRVANIFEEVIQPLKSKENTKKREKYNSILEGAVIVLADKGKDNLEIVSMFSYPYPTNLDINKKEKYKKEIFKYMLIDEFNNPKSFIRNRAIDMRIRPGSTFKIVTSIAGFKANMISKLDKYYKKYIEGRPDIYGTLLRGASLIDIKLKNFSFSNGFTERTDEATFKNSFTKSYNVYFGYLALLLNHKLDKGFKKVLLPISNSITDREQEFSLLKVADNLGFNKPIILSKERKIVAPPSIFPQQFILSKEIADSGIGQFEVAATPLQMAIVANTVRTRDIVIPKIIKDETSQIIYKNFISLSTQQAISDAMRDVIIDRDGTAKCAFYYNSFINQAREYNKKVPQERSISIPCLRYKSKFKQINPKDFAFSDVAVYGKTGTAEKGKGGLYDGWFVSFTKSKQRGDIVVVTVVRNSGTGGTYSATITKKVIEAWYNRDKRK
jgi:cell division protein FtsI/penicillin-binding protein 2